MRQFVFNLQNEHYDMYFYLYCGYNYLILAGSFEKINNKTCFHLYWISDLESICPHSAGPVEQSVT